MNGTPYYIDGDGIKKNIAYSADSHCYTFRMPEEDIVVDAVYKKVAAESMYSRMSVILL